MDGSARPQTVEKEINPLYWNLINEFGKRTGVPVVMNTSFNLRGEAIVNTPTDAVRTFFSSGMDALVIGSFLVEKIDRARQYCQLRVLKNLYMHAQLTIFTVSMEKISWIPLDSGDSGKAIFIPVGANIPEPSIHPRLAADGKKTVAIFSVTGGAHTLSEAADIGFAVKRASRTVGPVRLSVMGRGSMEAEPALRAEFSGTGIELEILGLLSAEEITRALARADVQLFVRGQISSRRGSAIAGIACGLPIVCYIGPETAWPITEAGILSVPFGDREALSGALERVLADDALRASLAERSRHAQEKYFSWRAIAAQFARALQSFGGTEPVGSASDLTVASSRE